VLSISPLLAWFFTLILVLLGGRATARLVLARGRPTKHPLSPAQRDRELGHAAMGFGMAVLLAPGLPRPPQAASVCFFAGLAAFAVFDWGRRLWDARQGRAGADSCLPAGERTHLLDPHHAIVGAAMVVMLLRPSGIAAGTAVTMPGMAMGGANPNAAVLFFLAYVWTAALALGYGMTHVLTAERPAPAPAPAPAVAGLTGPDRRAHPADADSGALLSSPATVYACELAMTVLTGLMLLN
jgi:hypothetical protein